MVRGKQASPASAPELRKNPYLSKDAPVVMKRRQRRSDGGGEERK
jgi:hypothetical protein